MQEPILPRTEWIMITAKEGQVVEYAGKKIEVAVNCGIDDGHWHCETCSHDLDHNNDRDNHIKEDPTAHVLVWICHVHGPETIL